MVRSISWSGGRAGSAWPSSSKQEAGSSFFSNVSRQQKVQIGRRVVV